MPHAPLGHHSAIPPRVGGNGGLISSTVRTALEAALVTDLSDVVGRLYTLDAAIVPLHEEMPKLVGVAVTAKASPGDNWAIHAALSRSGEGEVLVVDWLGYHEGCGAGVSSMIPAIKRGLAGVVIDGGWRDIDDIAALGVPVLGRGRTPFSPTKAQLGEVNVPVNCGGVIIEPGDVIVGDVNGVVCIPRWALGHVLAALEPTIVRTEIEAFDEDPLQQVVVSMGEQYWEAFREQGGVSLDVGEQSR